ncbi:MAG TPA: hypothetical protein PLL75_00975 [Candidatus Omnitrophota bacterium]|nr:hypothetical protein [Candidatus Omnitrophota bacterium]HPS36286.1 hypothetical protein [Candidatus Omnitrophota bacterium]
MFITERFCWGHLGKTGGDSTKAMFDLLGLKDILLAHGKEDPDKHKFFSDHPDLCAGKPRILNIRRLPMWLVSRWNHLYRRDHLQKIDRERITEGLVGMTGKASADQVLAPFLDSGIDHWLRVEYLAEDFIKTLQKFISIPDSVKIKIREIRLNRGADIALHAAKDFLGTGYVSAESVVLRCFSPQDIKRMYDQNPRWAAIERKVYGNLFHEVIDPALAASRSRVPKILLVGQSKSGTTALFFAVKSGMPADARALFEPHQYIPEEKDRDSGVLAKIVFNPGLDLPSFAGFDKKVLITRDPRDRILSNLLFDSLLICENLGALQRLLTLLVRKEKDPHSVPVKSLWAERIRLHRIPEGIRMFQEVQEFLRPAFIMKYEDFVDKKVRPLEDFLELKVDPDAQVSAAWRRVVRSKTYGGWKDWFTPADVEFFRPLFVPYMDKYQYPQDWDLNEVPVIKKEYSSEYVLRIVNERREPMGLFPLRMALRGDPVTAVLTIDPGDGLHSFDWQFYVGHYPDLQRAGINTKEKAEAHYLRFGKKERRKIHS